MKFQNKAMRDELPDLVTGKLPDPQKQIVEEAIRRDAALQKEWEFCRSVLQYIEAAQLSKKYETEAAPIADQVTAQLRQLRKEAEELQYLLPDYYANALPEQERRRIAAVLKRNPFLQRAYEEIQQTLKAVDAAQWQQKYEREARALSVLVTEQLKHQSQWRWRFRWQWALALGMALVLLAVALITPAAREWITEEPGPDLVLTEESAEDSGLLEELPIFSEVWYEDELAQPEEIEQLVESLASIEDDDEETGDFWLDTGWFIEETNGDQSGGESL